MAEVVERLLFIYNRFRNAQRNRRFGTKVLSINGCPLCSLTHSLAGERREWTTCKKGSVYRSRYVHRDELTEQMKSIVGTALPCIVAQPGGEITILLTRDVIGRCKAVSLVFVVV